jgi:hypothetical protein
VDVRNNAITSHLCIKTVEDVLYSRLQFGQNNRKSVAEMIEIYQSAARRIGFRNELLKYIHKKFMQFQNSKLP